jgi:hypothetical protein
LVTLRSVGFETADKPIVSREERAPAPDPRWRGLKIPATVGARSSTEKKGPSRVYRADSTDVVARTECHFRRRAWQAVAPNVWFLGITSLLTDISSEMVASVLPIYFVVQLNLSPLAFGALDGFYNGATAVTRWGSGVVADRWQRHKEVAAIGYGISALCRLGLLAAGRAWAGLAIAIICDRLGKGTRTVPRDALISLSATPRHLAQSFGVHRALDATGAMLGPVVAFALLSLVPGARRHAASTTRSIGSTPST